MSNRVSLATTRATRLTVTDYRCPICGACDLLIPADFGKPANGAPTCVACGTEFVMDGTEYVEWYKPFDEFVGMSAPLVDAYGNPVEFVIDGDVYRVAGSPVPGPVQTEFPKTHACVDSDDRLLCGNCRFDGACIFSV